MLAYVFKQIVMLSFEGSFIALVILIIRALLWRRLHPRLQYLLWAVLVVRLMLPVAPQSPFGVFSFTFPQSQAVLNSASTNITAAPTPESNIKTEPQKETPANSPKPINEDTGFNAGLNWETASVGWFFGCLAILIYIFSVNLTVLFRLRKRERCRDERILAELESCRGLLKLRRRVLIVFDKNFSSPVEFGFVHPKILISPALADGLNDGGLRHILLHELTHIKRHDVALNLLTMALGAVNWFNPLIWYAFSKMKSDCEISCDSAVLSALAKDERRSYGQTIISVLETASPARLRSGSIGFADNFNKRRIYMIVNNKKAPVLITSLAIILTLFAGCASLPAATQKTTSSGSGSDMASSITSSSSATASGDVAPASSADNSTSSAPTLSVGGDEISLARSEALSSFAKSNGYKIMPNSGDGGTLKLPSSFSEYTYQATYYSREKVVVSSQQNKYAEYFKNYNEQSKKYGHDFSAYLGTSVALLSYDTEKSDGTFAYLYGIFDGKKMIGVWAESHGLSSAKSNSETFGDLFSRGENVSYSK